MSTLTALNPPSPSQSSGSAKSRPRGHIAVEIVLHVSNRKLTFEVVSVKGNLLTWGNEKFWGVLHLGTAGSRTQMQVTYPFRNQAFIQKDSMLCHHATSGTRVGVGEGQISKLQSATCAGSGVVDPKNCILMPL